MITIKNFQIVESVDVVETSKEYQVKYSIFSSIFDMLKILYSSQNPNLVKFEGSEGSLNRQDVMNLITEIIQVFDDNFDINIKNSNIALDSLVSDWKGFVALTSIQNAYADLIKSDDSSSMQCDDEAITIN